MKKNQIFWILVGFVLLLAACGGAASEAIYETASEETAYDYEDAVEEVAELVEVIQEVESVVELEIESESAFEETSTTDDGVSLSREQGTAPRRTRLIIKDGQIGLEVENTQNALDSVGKLTASVGGYIIDQNAYTLDGYGYVTMQIGVPVEEFERTMEALRKLGTVVKDAASGTDVTDEFIDLESRLGNLRIKQERLRTFMEEAKKIEDVLRLESELTKVEEELAIIQGRMNFLKDRSSFSTISIQIDPIVPTPTPSPTPTVTPTPTATPSPTPDVWRPNETAQVASNQLRQGFQGSADFLIYNGIVCGPWIILLIVLGYLAFAMLRRFGVEFPSNLRKQSPSRSRSTIYDQPDNQPESTSSESEAEAEE